jgi:hypothetical protein
MLPCFPRAETRLSAWVLRRVVPTSAIAADRKEETLMLRAWIMGLGCYVPERVVPNDEIPFLNERHERCAEQQTETNDAWIRELTGVEARCYVPADGSV